MRDLKWLKKEVNKLDCEESQRYPHNIAVWLSEVLDLIDQVEQPEITTEQALNKLAEKYPFSSVSIVAILEGHAQQGRYEQPALPVIPKFVSEWIKKVEEYDADILTAIIEGHYNLEVSEWLFTNEEKVNVLNVEKLMRAWLDGHTVEEKKYVVRGNNGLVLLLKDENGVREPRNISDNFSISYELTEQEIKEFDERYMAFAIPVEELDL